MGKKKGVEKEEKKTPFDERILAEFSDPTTGEKFQIVKLELGRLALCFDEREIFVINAGFLFGMLKAMKTATNGLLKDG